MQYLTKNKLKIICIKNLHISEIYVFYYNKADKYKPILDYNPIIVK